MSVVVGCRIGDELYQKMKADPRSNSEIIEQALKEHYNLEDKVLLTGIEPSFYRSWYYDLLLSLNRFKRF